YRCRRQRHGRQPAAVPAGAPGQRHRRAAVRNHLPRPGRAGIRLHLWLIATAVFTEVAMSRLEETLAMDRRRFLRASLAGGAVLLTGAGLLGPRLYAAANPPVGKTGKVLLEIFGD